MTWVPRQERDTSRPTRGWDTSIAEIVKTGGLDAGTDGITIQLPYNNHQPGTLTAIGETLRPLVTG